MWHKFRSDQGVVGIGMDVIDRFEGSKVWEKSISGKYYIPETSKECPYMCAYVITEYHNEPRIFVRCHLGELVGVIYNTDRFDDIRVPQMKKFVNDADFRNSQHKKYKIAQMDLRITEPEVWKVNELEFISDMYPKEVKSEDFENHIREEIEEGIDFYIANYGFSYDSW